MLEFFNDLFFPKQYIPHGHCYLWQTELVWLHVFSDLLIMLAYYSIPLQLMYFVRRRADVPFKGIFVLFSLFIVTCGTTHLMAVWTLWHPAYWLSGAIKAVTALVSCYTVWELAPILPQALALPSPAKLEAANRVLEQEVVNRQRAEEELRQSLKELSDFKYALDQSAIVAITDAKGAITYANDKFCEISQYEREELIGQTHRIINSGYHAKEFFKDLWSTIASGQIWRGEIKNRAKDGSYYWVDTTIVPFLDEGRKPLQYLAIRTDITARKQAEEEIDRFFSLSIDLLCIASMDGFFKRLNPAFEITLGYTLEELKERPFLDFIHPEDVPATLAEIEKLSTGQPTIAFENRYRCKDGSYKWLSWVSMPFPAEGLLYAAARDITEQKQTNRELREFATQLERSNRELQDFAYVASHDLQEPLRKIQTFGDRLQAKCGEALTDKGRDYLERMLNASGRAQTLISDLLAFSRVTTKAQPFVPVNLTEVMQEVLSDLEVRIEKVGAKVELTELPLIDADPLQMRQLFQNLVGNALKFRREGVTPTVEIKAQLLEEQREQGSRGIENRANPSSIGEHRFCQISVADNGIGFEEKYLDRIFTVFQRLHSRKEYEGTGVGLAICRKIVERHGGSITAKSTPGQGTTFIITLPVKQLSNSGNNKR